MTEASFHSLSTWERDSRHVIDRICSTRAKLKVVLKVKDELLFLRKWIDHYSGIVGLENLTIFDNMSEVPDVAETYAEYGEALNVVRFKGFHNNIHRVQEYPELYNALQASCDYFAFLDCDEFLVYVDGDHHVHRGPEVANLVAETRAGVIPGSWLDNVQGFEQRFWWDLKQNHHIGGLRTGKPLISAAATVSGLIGHNKQIDKNLYDQQVVTNFFVLHLKRLSAQQRIATNMRKLHAYNAFKRVVTLEEVAAFNADQFPVGNPRNWVREIQSLLTRGEQPTNQLFRKGMIEIDQEGRLVFSQDVQRSTFDDFLLRPWDHVRQAFEI